MAAAASAQEAAESGGGGDGGGGAAAHPTIGDTDELDTLHPEVMFGHLHGRAVEDELRGLKFAFEVGGIESGWLLDCSRGGAGVVTRYAVQRGRVGGGAAGVTASAQYRDVEAFRRVESGEQNEMAAVMTGALVARGDVKQFGKMDAMWRATKLALGGKRLTDEGHAADAEERAVVEALSPVRTPWNPCSGAFWRRHFGTDALVGSWLFLISSAVYLGLGVVLVEEAWGGTASAQINAWVNAFSGLGFTLGSIYFIILSYPEVMMVTMMRSLRVKTATLSWRERFFTANEMLLATWCFLLAMLPYLVLAGYYAYAGAWVAASAWFLGTLLMMACVAVWVIASMPDNMQENQGLGSSYFFDALVRGCCCLPLPEKEREKRARAAQHSEDHAVHNVSASARRREAYLMRHLGNDFLAGTWLFLAIAALGTLFSLVLLYYAPTSVMAWLFFFSIAPFAAGSLLFIRASYPEYMNESICCGKLSWPPRRAQGDDGGEDGGDPADLDDDELDRCCIDICGCCAPRKKQPIEEPLLDSRR